MNTDALSEKACVCGIGSHDIGRFTVAVVALIFMLALSACTTQTAGMQSPVGHDYDGLEWRPLAGEVNQRLVVAPGYTALVENDPNTRPEDLASRITELPEDVRRSTLREIRIAVRPMNSLDFQPDIQIELVALAHPDEPIAFSLDELRAEGDWLVFDRLPATRAGESLEIRLFPAEGWEYGFASNRVPYGGYQARTGPTGAEQRAMAGAIAFQTVFNQDTDLSSMISGPVSRNVRNTATDPVLLIAYGIILTVCGAVWFVRKQEVGVG